MIFCKSSDDLRLFFAFMADLRYNVVFKGKRTQKKGIIPMKYQLRLLAALTLICLSLLCGCHSTPEILPPHTTTMTYCRHDNNYYFYGYHSGNFNPALDTEVPLCFDPLCSHKEYDEKKKIWYSVCPQNLGQSMPSAIT